MLYSIAEVNEQFMAAMQGVTIHDAKAKTDRPVLVRYARMSSGNYTEEQPQQIYPCVSILDYAPSINEKWYLDLRQYAGGISRDGLTAFLFRRPIWMEFRFDVSIAAKSYFDYQALKDYFLSHYVANCRFLFNKKLTGEMEVGDVVPYKIRVTDIPRTDGIFEANYEFTLEPWVTPCTPEQVATVQEVVLKAEVIDIN